MTQLTTIDPMKERLDSIKQLLDAPLPKPVVKKKQEDSYLPWLRNAGLAVGGLGALGMGVGYAGINPQGRNDLVEFAGATDNPNYQALTSSQKTNLYAELGSKALQAKLFGVPVGLAMQNGRDLPSVPDVQKDQLGGPDHYLAFREGPLAAKLQLYNERGHWAGMHGDDVNNLRTLYDQWARRLFNKPNIMRLDTTEQVAVRNAAQSTGYVSPHLNDYQDTSYQNTQAPGEHPIGDLSHLIAEGDNTLEHTQAIAKGLDLKSKVNAADDEVALWSGKPFKDYGAAAAKGVKLFDNVKRYGGYAAGGGAALLAAYLLAKYLTSKKPKDKTEEKEPMDKKSCLDRLELLKQAARNPENCPSCGASMERGDDGKCNRCNKPWPMDKQSGMLWKDRESPVRLKAMLEDKKRKKIVNLGLDVQRTQDPRWLTSFFSNPANDVNRAQDAISRTAGGVYDPLNRALLLSGLLQKMHPDRYEQENSATADNEYVDLSGSAAYPELDDLQSLPVDEATALSKQAAPWGKMISTGLGAAGKYIGKPLKQVFVTSERAPIYRAGAAFGAMAGTGMGVDAMRNNMIKNHPEALAAHGAAGAPAPANPDVNKPGDYMQTVKDIGLPVATTSLAMLALYNLLKSDPNDDEDDEG